MKPCDWLRHESGHGSAAVPSAYTKKIAGFNVFLLSTFYGFFFPLKAASRSRAGDTRSCAETAADLTAIFQYVGNHCLIVTRVQYGCVWLRSSYVWWARFWSLLRVENSLFPLSFHFNFRFWIVLRTKFLSRGNASVCSDELFICIINGD